MDRTTEQVPAAPKLVEELGPSEGGPRVPGARGAKGWVPRVLGVPMVLVLASIGTTSAQQMLPAGAGADVIKARCVSCHETDLISSQRLALGGWTREIDKMVRWGAAVAPEQRDILQTYLVANFGPRPSASHPTTSAAPDTGEATLTRACLSCHGLDLVEQQRLSRAGWVREVDKMMRWGATVNATEKDALVDHLTARYGVR